MWRRAFSFPSHAPERFRGRLLASVGPMKSRCIAALLAAALVPACTPRVPSKPIADAYLRLSVRPADATVSLDDRVLGSARVLEGRWIAVPHGVHRLSLTSAGFDRHDEDLNVAAGRQELTVQLNEIPER